MHSCDVDAQPVLIKLAYLPKHISMGETEWQLEAKVKDMTLKGEDRENLVRFQLLKPTQN